MNPITANLPPQNPSRPITKREHLHYYLDVAMILEHATIPPYLTAAYSAYSKRNTEAIENISEVAREEMLHLTLAANLLNAVGGKPDLKRKGFVPTYPCHLPDGETDFEVNIARFSEPAIDTFLKIERPSHPDDRETPTQDHDGILYVLHEDLDECTRGQRRGFIPSVANEVDGKRIELHYWSIGEFYNAIRKGLRTLCDEMGETKLFCGDPTWQVNPKDYFSGAGAANPVLDLDSALGAIEEISVQGEGYTNETMGMGKELAHFYRFEQIKLQRRYQEGDMPHLPQGEPFSRDYAAVWPIKKNAKIADYNDFPIIREQAKRFNGQYRDFLAKLHDAFNGNRDLLGNTSKDMFAIRESVIRLIGNPLPRTGENAAPTFEMDQCLP